MSVPQEFVVWEWLDVNGDPVYVGYGKMPMGHKTHPAKKLYQLRNQSESDLNTFLRSLGHEPDRGNGVPTTKMYHSEAKAVVYARRQALKKQGFILLSTRPYGTISGGGLPRAVRSPDGEEYSSVREAAAAIGVNPCTITRQCANKKRGGWKYINR